MGDLLFWYVIFALTTSLTSNFLLLVPIMRELKNYADNPQIQPMLNGKILVVIIFNIAAFITAPLIFVAMIIEEKRGGFVKAFIKGALTHDVKH